MAALAGLALAAAEPSRAQTKTDNDPVAPFRIADGLYYVGASDIASYLISTDQGLILIDGGYAATAPQILANLKTLGFEPKQVKILLNTHGHLDHAGGLAALKAATGATLYASAEDGALMARGGKGDFFLRDTAAYPPVKPDKTIGDGETVTLAGVTLTAHLTPGHTKGCTTWTFPVKVDGVTRQALVLCSLTVLPGYRLVDNPDYPGIAKDYAASHATWARLPCEVFLASHRQFYRGAEKRAAMRPGAPNPFVDPEGCRSFFVGAKARYDAELKRQTATP
jgi:metallo-beta-lactamase class B